ncbi:tRNA (guanosine(46)-N7)-methyltransferase TrmB [Pelagibacterium halotolerans]|uniref:tRNA (guanine-N(7)-)-methyltransferase n=1 Tax=Pelagibacterium halotolerans (strain DSM 22347 / JCM 15775 / CGMCC 1.7692 / B2) TaxID=1082931 RepID=G4RA58_PELHB|nr:tRNA (guanosine(46)-N7)-methyltransferase TrmB [Pelagibacterium halotolerans]AEQ53541.1 tRNA (guanine-N(7)-)-methyltransferase [Pelagibacterium halotolerans B2]QJR20281.1 tRNA (guanosine(46)-N7)-methyltransferase TrmB [Pelagibacterium halotolerans]SEA57908.1 tRNA (guanine-N7-)-methyltransferase [Pelagibacterium halotolerans]
MTPKPIPQDPKGPRAFFGRRAGKKLHKGQQALFETLLPKLTIDISAPVDPRKLFPKASRIHLEIGYGGGEHLARMARENPRDGFIGCEVFTGGIGKLLETIDAEGIENIALFPDDVIKLLAVLPDASVDCLYVLYPDPWPKPRHHKRRLIQFKILAEFARVLKPAGLFRFATDIEDYANWTLAHISRTDSFDWPIAEPGAWHAPYPGWQATRYEQKARRQGRMKSFYFEFLRS